MSSTFLFVNKNGASSKLSRSDNETTTAIYSHVQRRIRKSKDRRESLQISNNGLTSPVEATVRSPSVDQLSHIEFENEYRNSVSSDYDDFSELHDCDDMTSGGLSRTGALRTDPGLDSSIPSTKSESNHS
jgi:hypothetical protein